MANSEPTRIANAIITAHAEIPSVTIRGKYKSYTMQEKKRLVEEATAMGLRPTARKHKLALNTLVNWCKADHTVQRHANSGRVVGGGDTIAVKTRNFSPHGLVSQFVYTPIMFVYNKLLLPSIECTVYHNYYTCVYVQ